MLDILLCTDLDRTLLPNGRQPSSPNAMRAFCRFVAEKSVTLAYVSGRDRNLLADAINTYSIPVPDYAIGDVGTTIYTPKDGWQHWQKWEDEICRDWQGKTATEILPQLRGIDEIWLQEQEKQNRYKLSFYSRTDVDITAVRQKILSQLNSNGLHACVIWSIDEKKDTGLIDILPKRATKIDAVKFLMREKGFSEAQTVFAGDSGNDLPALTSGLNAVLVKNSSPEVKTEALNSVKEKGLLSSLYVARGDFLGLNGNYAAGILEGISHFYPEAIDLIRKGLQ